ncbi:MAG: xanthine dehydrogenase family protein molybdopterin-binding subunit [Alphaproteobacteria bacterium]|nr:MAG: xanthine dehydrogenase family protein molybdopterin-binding subunit [Alphaproteobacteria bacterium]
MTLRDVGGAAPNSKNDGRRGWVGRSIRRVEDPALVAGHGRFTGNLPAARHVRFVRSSVASGRIVRIAAPEGAMVLTAAELESVKPIRPMLHGFNYVPISQPVLARDIARFVGEPLAAVVALSRDEAEDIADLVEVEIEETPAIVGTDAALAPGAALVHAEAAGNIAVEGRVQTPGFESQVARAYRLIKVEIRSHRQNALPLEPRAAHAAWDTATARVTLTCATQMPHAIRTIIADLIEMPESDLRVIAPDVGGGFGQKMSLAAEFVVVTWLARTLKTSVAWVEDRRENLIACFHSRDQSISLEGAFDPDAKVIGFAADIVADVGAYSCYPTTCAVEPLMAMAELPGPYDVREYSCIARGVLTNTCPMAPYRGVSRPVITFAVERLMDKAAAAFGLDPIEMRRRNLIKTFPHTSVTGLVLDDASYIETMEAAVKALGVPGFRARQAKARAEGRYFGLGVATFCERTGYGSQAFAARGMEVTPGWETVDVSMDPSGFVEARIGASPHGQGLRTTLSQIIADELGTSPERIKIVHGDTDRTPYGWGTFASRSLVIAGGASLLAARKVRAKLTQIAGMLLEASAGDIVLEADTARVAGTDRSIPITVLARAAYHQAHRFKGEIAPGIAESATYDPLGTFSNACHVAVVEVDPETGRVRVEKFLVAEDAGRLINPMIVDGQIHGGVAQGIANALFEEIIYDESGNILTASLADYLPPTAWEIPDIEIHHLATLTQASVTRAKGLGEGGAIGAPAAVVNAINDALAPFGVLIDEFPATPQRVHAALRAAGALDRTQGE